MKNGTDPSHHHFIWDLTNSAHFGCVKDPRLAGLVPCVLRGHILWDTKLGRPLTGTELLRVHGFCLEPDVAKLDDGNAILSKLAGDTISVPPVGTILLLGLANICPPALWPKSSNFQTQCDHHIGPRWIGPSAWRGYDRSNDNLYKVAGLGHPSGPSTRRAKNAKKTTRSRKRKRELHAYISLD